MTSLIRPSSFIGKYLAEHRIVRLLGSGGVAHVFEAQSSEGRSVAVKVLRPELLRKRTLVARFEREAAVGARVRHPNVLEVRPVQRGEGELRWFVMELLEGIDLADELAARRKLSPEHAVRVALGVADGLAAAHAVGVVHRDLKPENVFLVRHPGASEAIKVLDFGFAWLSGAVDDVARPRLTTRGGFVGTPEYVAPEQSEGALGHPTADVYALGVLLFELIVGRVPFRGATWLDTIRAHASEPVPEVDFISPALSRALRRMLAKSPVERTPTMTLVAEFLRATPEAAQLAAQSAAQSAAQPADPADTQGAARREES